MSEVAAPPKATPGRRRNGRGNGKAGNQKAYASENDAGMIDPSRFQGTPQTPHKYGTQSPAQGSAPSSQANTKTRTRNKNKGAELGYTPESSSVGHHATPQRAASASTSKANMAFAGATFHASPAPSALPMPSLFQRPSNESPVTHSKTQEPSPPATDTEAPTPQRPAPRAGGGSPLDFMFQAHREERERERRGSNLSQQPMTGASFSPSQSPAEHNNVRGSYSVPHTRAPLARHSSASRIGSEELDGSNGLPMGPAFSTPYQDRIRAARTTQPRQDLSHAQSPSQPPRQFQHQASAPAELEDKTEALKRFLNLGNNGSPPGPQQASHPAPNHQQQNFPQPNFQQPNFHQQLPPGYGPQPTHHVMLGNAGSVPGPSPPGPGGPVASNDIQAMENDLRRILKLNLGSAP